MLVEFPRPNTRSDKVGVKVTNHIILTTKASSFFINSDQ